MKIGDKVRVLETAKDSLNLPCSKTLPCEGIIVFQYAVGGFVVASPAWIGIGNPPEDVIWEASPSSTWDCQNLFADVLEVIK